MGNVPSLPLLGLSFVPTANTSPTATTTNASIMLRSILNNNRKASTEVLSKCNATESKTQRQTRNSLSSFEELPLDIVLTILEHLTPLDLLHLTRTTKPLRVFLLSRERSEGIWRFVREGWYPPTPTHVQVQRRPPSVNSSVRVPPPEPPRTISEVAYAHLIFSTAHICDICDHPASASPYENANSKEAEVKVELDLLLGKRVCGCCRDERLLRVSEVDITGDAVEGGHSSECSTGTSPSIVAPNAPSSTKERVSLTRLLPHIVRGGEAWVRKEDINQLMNLLANGDEGEGHWLRWIALMKAEAQAIRRCEDWLKGFASMSTSTQSYPASPTSVQSRCEARAGEDYCYKYNYYGGDGMGGCIGGGVVRRESMFLR